MQLIFAQNYTVGPVHYTILHDQHAAKWIPQERLELLPFMHRMRGTLGTDGHAKTPTKIFFKKSYCLEMLFLYLFQK